MVFFKRENIVSTGDLYFSGMYPIFHPEHHGSLKGLLRNIEWILQRTPNESKIIPGHGPMSSKAEFAEYHDMIVDSISTVEREMADGYSIDKIKKTGLNKKWQHFSHGYRNTDQWLESIYESLR